MVAVPAATPVTTPVEEPTVATEVLVLNHVPPGTISLRVIVLPVATAELPVIGATGSTVKVTVAMAVPTIYVIVAVPADTPVTTPVDEPIVATAVLLLLQ